MYTEIFITPVERDLPSNLLVAIYQSENKNLHGIADGFIFASRGYMSDAVLAAKRGKLLLEPLPGTEPLYFPWDLESCDC